MDTLSQFPAAIPSRSPGHLTILKTLQFCPIRCSIRDNGGLFYRFRRRHPLHAVHSASSGNNMVLHDAQDNRQLEGNVWKMVRRLTPWCAPVECSTAVNPKFKSLEALSLQAGRNGFNQTFNHKTGNGG